MEKTNVILKNINLENINKAAVLRASQKLPELIEKTRAFDRSNSQTTISMMTLTMLNGQSPMRMLRQVLAEVENRRLALAESETKHAEAVAEIEFLESEPFTKVNAAKLRMKKIFLSSLEDKINGAIKDISVLADCYDNLKIKHQIPDNWSEIDFERDEKQHHIRRGFELLYRNILQCGRPHESSMEYLQQFGVHIQIALNEVIGYISVTDERIRKGDRMTSADLENFLDEMSVKYLFCADEASENLFGKSDFTNKDYMLRLEKKE